MRHTYRTWNMGDRLLEWANSITRMSKAEPEAKDMSRSNKIALQSDQYQRSHRQYRERAVSSATSAWRAISSISAKGKMKAQTLQSTQFRTSHHYSRAFPSVNFCKLICSLLGDNARWEVSQKQYPVIPALINFSI
jgi:hypothetical protein